jgi:formylglycine-generating enzyme required for sulfatase activity
MAWLPRAGLSLPSEKQWEMGCRGGSSSVFWSGDEKETLQGVANLADHYGKQHGGESLGFYEPWLEDENTVHAAVGSYRANAFGLHDTHGNVWEWCLDEYDSDFYGRSTGAANRIARGSGFDYVATFARAAFRYRVAPSVTAFDLGVRPARAITE